MALISISTPSLIQGVSQQPPTMRFASQGEIQENCYPSVLDGLQKRHPFEHVATLRTGGYGAPLVHFINRDESERYAVLAYGIDTADGGDETKCNVSVWDLTTGEVVPVYGTGGWGSTPDFTYLALPPTDDAAVLLAADFKSLGLWTSANSITPSLVSIPPPLGSRDSGSNITTQTYKIGNSGTTGATYSQAWSTGTLESTGTTASLCIRRNDAAAQTPLSALTLGLLDTTASSPHTATFSVGTSGDYSCTITAVTGNATAHVDTLPNGWFRVSLTYSPLPTEVGDALSFTVALPNATANASILVWGARIDSGLVALLPTARACTALKAVTVADYTFLLNTTTATATTSTTTAEDPGEDAAFVFVNAGNYKTGYTVNLGRVGGSDASVTTKTWDGLAGSSLDSYSIQLTGSAGTPTTGVWSIKVFDQTCSYTNDASPTIAEALLGLINAVKTKFPAWSTNLFSVLTDVTPPNLVAKYAGQVIGATSGTAAARISFTQPAGSGTATVTHNTEIELLSIKTDDIATDLALRITGLGDGWSATAYGSLVKITNASSDIDKCEVSDSRGDTNITAVWDSVPTFDVLPLSCEHNYVIKVAGDPVAAADDYWVKFAAKEGSGVGEGNWVECARPTKTPASDYTRTTLDAATLPHQLVRREDGVNGRYFEFGPVVWNTKVVGDETLDPIPSFISPDYGVTDARIDDIFFWKNRLGFLSGQSVCMSAAGEYFNFWRSTVRAVLDTDPIDLNVAHTEVVHLRHAVPFDDELYLFADQVQFKLWSDPILSPAHVQTAPVLEFPLLTQCRPVVASRGIFFATPRGAYSGVQQVVGAPNTARVDTFDLSGATPKYIPGALLDITGSDSEACLVMRSVAAPGSLFVYKYHDAGQDRVQSAWHTYTLGQEVLGMVFIGSDLFVVVQRFLSTTLERATISAGEVDDGLLYKIPLDRRVAFGPTTGRGATIVGSDTVFALPYAIDPNDEVYVVNAADGSSITKVSKGTLSGQTSVTVVGSDYRANSVLVGVTYTQKYRFTRPVVREAQSAGKTARLGGRLQVLRLLLAYNSSMYGSVAVTPATGSATATSLLSLAAPVDGVYSVGIGGEASDITVTVTNNQPLPLNLTSAEWECNYTTHTTLVPS